MAQRAGRVTCPKCGANNFDTVTSCWKCGTPMGASATAMAAAPVQMASQPAYVERMPQQPQQPQPMAYAPPAPASAPSGDSRVARRAAIALALAIPWVGLPVGWVFMMIEDSRKQTIGRICVWWSIIGLVPQILLMLWMTQITANNLLPLVTSFIKGYTHSAQEGGGAEGGSGPAVPKGYSD